MGNIDLSGINIENIKYIDFSPCENYILIIGNTRRIKNKP